MIANQNNSFVYLSQLDALRAIAVILVIISHWFPSSHILNTFPNAVIGVDMFFVLSGFLITKILFENRNKADLHITTKKKVLKNFILRRSLRIFPIYYLSIFFLLIFHKYTNTDIAFTYPYFLTYTSNFYFYSIKTFDGIISHLWSLAVEEQFYLVWPWLILFVKRKYFLYLICLFILIGIMSQYYLAYDRMSTVLTFTCFDALGFGALLAWIYIYKQDMLNNIFFAIKYLTIILIVYLVLVISFDMPLILPIRTIISLFIFCLIYFIITDRFKIMFKNIILNNQILIFIGKISYGLYLYHPFISRVNKLTINKFLNPLLPKKFLEIHSINIFLFQNIILLLLISWMSYIFIEKKFLNLKKYFEY